MIIVIGDCKCPEECVPVRSLNALRTQRLDGKGVFLDADDLDLKPKDIGKLAKRAKGKVLLVVRNRERLPSNLPPGVKVVERNPWGERVDIYEALRMVVNESDRQKVLAYLLEKRPVPIVLFNWLVSNVDQYPVMLHVLRYIDENVLHKKDEEWFYEFLAFGVTPTQDYIRFNYRIKTA